MQKAHPIRFINHSRIKNSSHARNERTSTGFFFKKGILATIYRFSLIINFIELSEFKVRILVFITDTQHCTDGPSQSNKVKN